MRWTHAFPLLASATSVLATVNFNNFHPDLPKRQVDANDFLSANQQPKQKRQTPQSLFLTNQTTSKSDSYLQPLPQV